MKKILFIFIGIALTSCSPKIKTSITKSYNSIAYESPVAVFKNEKDVPKDAILVEKTSIGAIEKSTANTYNSNNQNTTNKRKKSKFLLLGNVAQSYRIAESPKGLSKAQENYVDELKSGISYDFSAYYLIQEELGFGLKYNLYNSKGALSNQVLPLSNGNFIFGTIKDNITIQFIGASLIYTESQRARIGEAYMELALGYMSLNNDASLIAFPLNISGGNLGISAGFGYHFRINKNILIGPTLNFLGGTLREFKYTYADGSSETINLSKDQYESLWRIDLAIGAKIRL